MTASFQREARGSRRRRDSATEAGSISPIFVPERVRDCARETMIAEQFWQKLLYPKRTCVLFSETNVKEIRGSGK